MVWPQSNIRGLSRKAQGPQPLCGQLLAPKFMGRLESPTMHDKSGLPPRARVNFCGREVIERNNTRNCEAHSSQTGNAEMVDSRQLEYVPERSEVELVTMTILLYFALDPAP